MPTRRSFTCQLAALSGTVALGMTHSLTLAAHSAPATPVAKPGDWPWWRGPSWNGIAEAGQQPPTRWSNDAGLAWQVPVPGRSHGSPIVVDNQVLIEIADSDRGVQSLLCVDRENGKTLWETVIHRDGLNVKNNEKSTMASASPACDGERFFVNFLSGDAVWMTALSRTGAVLWQVKLSSYVNHQGFGSSPLLYDNLVIGVSDNKGGGAIVAMQRDTGKIIWKRDRPAKPNYPSPVILEAAGRSQLFLTGCDLVTSLDPATGTTLWEVPGATTECVTTTVTDGQRIFTSGGYPKNHVSAVAADGSGKLVWENSARVYVPSMLLHDGVLHAVLDAGVAICWDSATGTELWKGRLGGTFSSSPVLVNGRIYATNEEGRTFIYAASRDGLKIEAENQLGDSVFATPAICGGRIYQRIARTEGTVRQEYLVCIR